MDQKTLERIRSRTDKKLRYAKVHLDELRSSEPVSGDDFDRAHQESFLYHLLGAKEAFIHELNFYYDGRIDPNALTQGKLRNELNSRGIKSKELGELYKLENDKNSWLFHAKEMRDFSTHISGIIRAFHLGGERNGQIYLKNPKTNEVIPNHFVQEFSNWQTQMEALLERLRNSAIETNLSSMG